MNPWFLTLPCFHWIQGNNASYHELRFEKDSRYYVLRLEKDLLEDWTILAINGRIKSKLGQSRTFAYVEYEKAFGNLCLLANVRQQRRYQLKSFKTCHPLFFHCLMFLLSTAERHTKSPKKMNHTNARRIQQKPTANLPNSKTNLSPYHQISFDF
ncbi:hypothetical protein E3983_05195 [Legionella israelensis]|uniref:WGR domain-containing protein n=1 Tax=Legionella israelensis TaxID=454 RepID=A0AAX1EFG0_9GAMM|nr:hypothetical protein [Legionella israelensis]QBR83798.1 hypothetical protein E3983_05195 [Legionella israelensis]